MSRAENLAGAIGGILSCPRPTLLADTVLTAALNSIVAESQRSHDRQKRPHVEGDQNWITRDYLSRTMDTATPQKGRFAIVSLISGSRLALGGFFVFMALDFEAFSQKLSFFVFV